MQDIGFVIENLRTGSTRRIAYCRATDELQVMPLLRTALMVTCATARRLLADADVQVREGFRRTKLAPRDAVIRMLLNFGSMQRAVSRQHATELAKRLKRRRPREKEVLRVGRCVRKPAKRKGAPITQHHDVVFYDRLWDRLIGRDELFAVCHECRSKTINPLHARSTVDRSRLCCLLCARRQDCLPRAKRSRRRALVWLAHFGLSATGRCAAGCGEVLHFVRPWHQGHVQSSAEGGSADVSNMLPICGPCNRQQGTEHMQPYAKREHHAELVCAEERSMRLKTAEMLYDCLLRGHDPRAVILKT